MMIYAVSAALLLAAAVSLSLPTPTVTPTTERDAGVDPTRSSQGWMRRGRPIWAVLAAFAGWAFVGGALGLVVGLLAGAGCWVGIGRAESPARRREREAVRRDLPALVRLLGAPLAAGASPVDALEVVTAALPGPASDRLGTVLARLRLGADPVTTWRALESDPALAPLGRTLARAYATGAPVVAAIDRLGEELARTARAEVEDRARAVGVKAAVPLGLCLLPSFVLIGIVPVVGGLLRDLMG